MHRTRRDCAFHRIDQLRSDPDGRSVSIGAVSAFFATGAPGEISTAPMATLPLLLIPAFLVPLFLMLHTAALMQSRQLIRARA
jgi:hypothetical protein